MASSGSVDFSVTRDQIISDALENMGRLAIGGTPTAAQTTQMARKLNMIVKQWMGKSDFAPGLKQWSRKTAYLFLNTGHSVYTLGPTATETGTTNKWASSYVQTTLSANAAASASSVSLTSATGISSTDRIGIVLNDGTVHWTIATMSGTTANLTTALASAANSGNVVFAYATANQGRRPLHIISACLRTTDTIDYPPMEPMLREEYEGIGNKIADGTPQAYLYEDTLTDGTLTLNIEPSDATFVVRIIYLSPIEDFDSATDTPDYPQEWYRPLCSQLTIDGAPSYGVPVTQEMKMIRDESLAIARNANPEVSHLFFQPGAE